MAKKTRKKPATQIQPKKNPSDPRKHPAAGYAELNPSSKSDLKKPIKQPK